MTILGNYVDSFDYNYNSRGATTANYSMGFDPKAIQSGYEKKNSEKIAFKKKINLFSNIGS